MRVPNSIVNRTSLKPSTVPHAVRHATQGTHLTHVPKLDHDIVTPQYAAALVGSECVAMVLDFTVVPKSADTVAASAPAAS